MLNITELFTHNLNMLTRAEMIIDLFKHYHYVSALKKCTVLFRDINKIVEILFQNEKECLQKGIEVNKNFILNLLKQMLTAQEQKDYILLSDILQQNWIPYFLNIQYILVELGAFGIDEQIYNNNIPLLYEADRELGKLVEAADITDRYVVEPSSIGVPTLKVINHDEIFYMHSRYMPHAEARDFARSIIEQGKYSYVVYGLGLGYMFEMFSNIDPTSKIDIYESDIEVIKIWMSCINLTNFFKYTRYTLHYDPDFHKILKVVDNISENTEFVMHLPSVRNIRNEEIKLQLQNYFYKWNGLKNQIREMEGNFYYNINHCTQTVDVLRKKFQNKNIYIIAGGPSLDINVNELKKVSKDSIMIATGTVVKKLLNLNIRPDYIMMTDAAMRTIGQIRGLEIKDIPIIILSTATYRIIEEHKGEIYLTLQRDFPLAEEYAQSNRCHIFQTGGSVSTTALDICMQLGAGRIIFVGLDLAYTGNQMHAQNTSSIIMASTDGLIEVEDIHGGHVLASPSLNNYRKWIEARIKNISGVEIIDATEGGAKIQGMKVALLKEVIF